MTFNARTVLLLGGSSQLTPCLLTMLGDGTAVTIATSSDAGRWRGHDGVTPLQYPRDAPERLKGKLDGPWDAVISLMPVTALPAHLPALQAASIGRFVALSTASVKTKAASRSPAEKAFLRAVNAGETAFFDFLHRTGTPGVLLRPAMTYGGHDNNVDFIRRIARRFGFFPVVRGTGLRQPVHVEDVTSAVIAALHREKAAGNTYFLAGGEVLTFEAMTRRILVREFGRARVLRIPAPLLALAVKLLSLLPRFSYLDPDMVRRMREDHVFDNEPARRDLGFSPRGFLS